MFLLPITVICSLVLYIQTSGITEPETNKVFKLPKTIEEINALHDHAFDIRGSHPDSLFIYANINLKASQELNYQNGIAKSYTHMGVYHYQKSNHGKAIEYYLKAKKIFDQEKLYGSSASTSNNIGLVYFREGDYPLALKYHQEAIDIATDSGDIVQMANYKLNKALAINRLSSFSEALPIFYEAIRDLEQTKEYEYLSNAYLNLGNNFGANGQLDSVKKYFDKGLEVAEKTSDFETLSYAYTSQIKYYVVTENPRAALDYAEKSLSNALKSGSIFNISDAYHTISTLQEDTGDIEGALHSFKMYFEYKDSLRKNEQTLEIARLEGSKIIEREKELFEFELKTKEKSNQQKVLIIILLVILTITLVTLYYVVSKNLKGSKKRNQILLQKNKEVKKLAKNLKKMNDHQHQIFSIIGHDLNGPVSSLVTVADLINEKQLSEEDLLEIMPQLSSEIKRAKITLENLLHWALSQKEGESLNLIKFKLRELFVEIVNSLQYAIDRKKQLIEIKMDEELYLEADRQMIQISLRNLISNAIKFTPEGGMIKCKAFRDGELLKIEIDDNGIGMDHFTLSKLQNNDLISNYGTNNESGTGLGLALCRGYVEKNGGTMHIQSEINVGTKIILEFR
ncbi:tetratricopeptide repeat protein [Belliella kenyensis]|uniref:histidine kinase n=1 Tax=Belliella kenyensis TaxID=1472724 RepID=A0ABV8EIB5_9BACT|nr:tetratricopeptide repeat-containing sensor histidine kinase [Belliella kenyensis]MCH7401175.1 tetratricopeptide repeat-containing sensor histidine kinase [Belliella kenyensis]MDN3604172.1 tetratricopeptide repeat-containing sensor histidine kinase [Belliella kenyensis]